MPPKYQNWAVPRAPLQFPGALAHIPVFPVPLPMPLTFQPGTSSVNPLAPFFGVSMSPQCQYRACEAAAFSPVAQAVANRSSDGDIGIDSRAVRGTTAHEPFSHTQLSVDVITRFRLGQPSVRAENIVTCGARAH